MGYPSLRLPDRLILLSCLLSAAASHAQTSYPATASRAIHQPQQVALPGGGTYRCVLPTGYRQGDEPPLIICLHGTDETAGAALAFWTSCGMKERALWAAPQAFSRGWTEGDLRTLREMWTDIRSRWTFDANRVLVAGFSAGGAMAFYWVYREGFPATALATLANYVPPAISADDIRPRRDIPVFYAVGTEDINHDRMRIGLGLLRNEDVRVTLVRPPIPHILAPEVGRQALAWFEDRCRQSIARRLTAIRTELLAGRPGRAAAEARRFLHQRQWHDPEDVRQGEAILAECHALADRGLTEAERLIGSGQVLAALQTLRKIEAEYGEEPPATQARTRREEIESDPAARRVLAEHERREREEEATARLVDVQRMIAAGRFDQARTACEALVSRYDGTVAAARARRILERLPKEGSR